MRPEIRLRATRIVVALLSAGVLAGGTYAFTASNSVSASKAGDGNAAITGYTVNNITYTRDPSDPTLLSSYTFDLSAAATDVNAKPVTSQAVYDTCTNTTGNTWTCPATSGTTMLSLDNLRVIASE